jgi:hypothetical protein
VAGSSARNLQEIIEGWKRNYRGTGKEIIEGPEVAQEMCKKK